MSLAVDPSFYKRREQEEYPLFHSISLLLEGQGYILAMLAAYVQGRSFLWPKTVGLERRRDGYLADLKLTGKLYLPVILVLSVGAIYEVVEVVILAAMFSN